MQKSCALRPRLIFLRRKQWFYSIRDQSGNSFRSVMTAPNYPHADRQKIRSRDKTLDCFLQTVHFVNQCRCGSAAFVHCRHPVLLFFIIVMGYDAVCTKRLRLCGTQGNAGCGPAFVAVQQSLDAANLIQQRRLAAVPETVHQFRPAAVPTAQALPAARGCPADDESCCNDVLCR